MSRQIINNNITIVAIIIYILSYSVILTIKPDFLFNKDGSIREFGVGFRKKTIIPIWLISIILAILCYFMVMYYIALPRLDF